MRALRLVAFALLPPRALAGLTRAADATLIERPVFALAIALLPALRLEEANARLAFEGT